jgi:hypothetical protein
LQILLFPSSGLLRKRRRLVFFLSVLVIGMLTIGILVFVQQQRSLIRAEELNQTSIIEDSLNQAAELIIDPNFQNDTVTQGVVIELLTVHVGSSMQSLKALDSTQSVLFDEVDQTLQTLADPWTFSCLSVSDRLVLASTLISLGRTFVLGYSGSTPTTSPANYLGNSSTHSSSTQLPFFLFDFRSTSLNTTLVPQIISDTNTIGEIISCPSIGAL